MDLQELMRMGSLTMNFLQSDHFKQLMGMMGQFGMGQQDAGSNSPNTQVPNATQGWPQATNPFPNGLPNGIPNVKGLGLDQLLSNPLSAIFGSKKKNGAQNSGAFPFGNQMMPPWMQQVPRNPYIGSQMPNTGRGKKSSPLDSIMNLFGGPSSTQQNPNNVVQQPPNHPMPYMNPWMHQTSYSKSKTSLRSEKNRIRIKDATLQQQSGRKRSKR